MRVRLRKCGAGASIRIPATVLAAASLSLDQTVDTREEGGRIIIQPFRSSAYDLDRLLDAMIPETFHEEVGFGPPVRSEVW